jgi:transposase
MKETTRRLRKEKVTIGLDLGDKRHTFCVLDRRGEILKRGWLDNERNELAKLASAYLGALVIMEAGIHSPWISRFLDSLGMEVLVANPRKTRAIWQSERKSDERDALVLARLGRADRNLLSPIIHGSEEAQHDLLQIGIARQLGASAGGSDQLGALYFEELGLSGEQSFQREFPQARNGGDC